MDLSKKIFGSNIDPEVQKYFKNLQKGTFEIQPGDPLSDTSFDSSTQTYLGDRTPYARMWTAVNVVSVQKDPDNPSKFKPIGDGKNSVYIVNDNSFNSYESSELNSVSELGNNPLLKPAAGVTEVTSRAEGSLGALRRTVVKFVVYNKEDFDKTFLPFFLKPGSHIFVDFGWSDKAFSLYDPNDFIKNTDLELGDFYDTIYNDDDKIKSGFTTTVSGQVTKYDININQNQSFECTLEFVSSNYQLLDKEVSEDNNLKFIFTNVLEDLILLKYLNNSAEGSELVKEELSRKYLWNSIPREERSKNIKKFFDSNTTLDSNAPLIDNYSKLVGVFYQNFTHKSKSPINQKEALYISFAVFEDDFLNNYVATTVKKDDNGNIVSNTVDKTTNIPKFNSRNTYVRWDENLFNMMKIKPRSLDRVLSFLYPDTWDIKETSNKYKPNIIVEKGKEREWKNTSDDKSKNRIPMRELFIRTTTIIEAFDTSSNVNDALEKIFDTIFEDSGNLINIRLMKNNDFESSLTFHDANIEPVEKEQEKTFVFDITSGNTIVQNVDLKFETPKAGLSSMIAIGGLSTPKLFDDFQLMRFNILNGIQNDGLKKQIRHLPVFGETTVTENHIDVNISKILNTSLDNKPKNFSKIPITNVQDRYASRKEAQESYLKTVGESPDAIESDKINELDEDDKRTVFTANSERDIELIKAKVFSFVKSGTNSISPVLPISLTLEIYGNNFLNIGDYFTINFLPEHFKERVYFQIVGVDHSVSTSNWKTTYNTVMRPYSNKKYHQFGSTASDDLALGDRVQINFNGTMFNQLFSEFDKLTETNHPFKKDMVRQFEFIESNTLTYPISDVQSLDYASYLVNYDPKKIQPKIDKVLGNGDLKKNADKANKFIPLSLNSPPISTQGISWLVAVSNILLGDDVIDWKKFNGKFINTNQRGGGFKKSNELQYADENQVWIFPQNYNNKLGNIYSDITQRSFFNRAKRASEKDFQNIKDNFFNQLAKKQKISSEIENTKEVAGNSGFIFLNRIDWSLVDRVYDVKSNENKFKILHFSGNSLVDSFPVIEIPFLYLKIPTSQLANLLFKEYNKLFSELDNLAENIRIKVEEEEQEINKKLYQSLDTLPF